MKASTVRSLAVGLALVLLATAASAQNFHAMRGATTYRITVASFDLVSRGEAP